jgi:Bacterial TniB protein
MGITGDEFTHLLPSHRATATKDNPERIAWIRHDRWINHTKAEQVLAQLSDLLTYPPRSRMPSLLIFGAPGMGKTKIIDKFLRDHPAAYDEETGMTHSPVLVTEMPPSPSERAFYEGLLVSLGSVMPYGVAVNHLRHRFRVLARQMDVRMLIIDEINTMLAGSFREQRVFLNSIRLLANDLKLPLVCVGTQEAKLALMTDQQLADRFGASELPPWRDDLALGQLLASFESILPLRRPSNLSDRDVRKRMLALTDGITVRIFRLIETAAVRAIENGKECIDLDSLSDHVVTQTLVSISERRSRRAVPAN